MASYYFFSEVDLFASQSASQAFGPVSGFSSYKFLVTSKHTATSDPKAFAVCDGTVFVQEISGTNNVNLVLRPTQQPPFAFPKIKFFIYRNILKNTLVNGDEIAAAATNDLTQSIWDSQTAHNASAGVSGNPSKSVVGIDIATNDEIEKAFFKENVSFQLPVVKGGWNIGKFDKNGFGFEIVTDAVGFEPLLPAIRSSENIIEVTQLPGSPSALQVFSHWNEKETVLNYIDPCAFFGSFYNQKINCKKSSSQSVVEKNGVYNELLKGAHLSGSDGVFFNRHKIYLDIRNEYNFSINYFQNYGNNIQAAYDTSGALSTLNYYAVDWPLCILDNVFPSSVSTNNLNLRLSLPDGSGDNPSPAIYLSAGFWKDAYPREPKNEARLLNLEITAGFTNEIQLSLPRNTGISQTTPVSCYIKLKYLKRIDFTANPPASSGTVVRAQHYFDNIFRPHAMKIFYATANSVKSRFYDEEVFVDMTADGNFDFIGKTGIADDDTNLTLTVIPTIIRSQDANKFSLPAISSEMTTAFTDYLSYLADKFSNKTVRKSNFDFPGTGSDHYYLEVIDKDENAPDTIEEPQLAGVATISFNKADFNALSTSSFQAGLPVFFATDDWQSGIDNLGQRYSSFNVSLVGYTSNGTDIQVQKTASTLTIYFYERN
jgi:hypothetical protein